MSTTPESITHAEWGVSVLLAAPYAGCTVTDYDETTEPVHQNELDQKGAVVGDVVYDRKTTITFTAQIPDGLTHPKAGEMITVNGKTAQVTRVEIVQSNQAYQKVSITAEAFPNLTADVIDDQAGSTTSSAS